MNTLTSREHGAIDKAPDQQRHSERKPPLANRAER